MQHLISVPLDIERIASIKDRLTDLRNDLHELTRLNNARSLGRLIDPMQDARKTLFQGDGSDEFQIEVNSELGKNVRATGSPTSMSPFSGRYISRNNGLSRSLQMKCTDSNDSEWFGLEFDSDPDSLAVEKISDVYVFMQLSSDCHIGVWMAVFLSQGSHTTRIDLNNIYFDRNTRHAMLKANLDSAYDTSKEKTRLRLGCYFPTNMKYEVNILDIKLLCTL